MGSSSPPKGTVAEPANKDCFFNSITNWQKVVKGIVLLAAVVFDIVANKKNAGK